jgi:filamentous hemagglutinin
MAMPGEVYVVKGEIKHIDNSSGHYLPTGQSAQKAAEDAFTQMEFNTSGKYIEKTWIIDQKLPRGGAWRPQQ